VRPKTIENRAISISGSASAERSAVSDSRKRFIKLLFCISQQKYEIFRLILNFSHGRAMSRQEVDILNKKFKKSEQCVTFPNIVVSYIQADYEIIFYDSPQMIRSDGLWKASLLILLYHQNNSAHQSSARFGQSDF
jgi:hypothetical protein